MDPRLPRVKRWAVRDADDIREWLGQVVALPWADGPVPLAVPVERHGWRPNGPTARHGAKRDLPHPWQHVSAVSRDGATVLSLSLQLTRWEPAEGTVDDAPHWLRKDAYLRAVALATEVLGGAPDREDDDWRRFTDALWFRAGCHVDVQLAHAGVALIVRVAREPGPPRRSGPPVPEPPAGWDDLAERLASRLARLTSHGMLVVEDRAAADRGATFSWHRHRVAAEVFAGGRSLGTWLFEAADPAECRQTVGAALAALRSAGTGGPGDLQYQAYYDGYPNGGVDLTDLGLPWRPAPASLWQVRGSGAALPLSPQRPDGDGSYTVLFDQRDADVEPVALQGGTWRRRIGWDGTGWTELRVDLAEREPAQEVVAVDRLTAERVALVLTGVPLP